MATFGENTEYEDRPEYDDNGEPIIYIEEDIIPDEFKSENDGVIDLPQMDDSFYETVWGTGTTVATLATGDSSMQEEVTDPLEVEVEQTNADTRENDAILDQANQNYNNAVDTLIDILTQALAQGKITGEMNADILDAQTTKTKNEQIIKEICNVQEGNSILKQLEEIRADMVPANVDDILDILTQGGTKPWLYKDSDNNVMVDAQSIPELTVLVNKLNLIATGGDDDAAELQLTPEFINMVVQGTGASDSVKGVTTKYYLSTSKTELIGGSWLDDLPSVDDQQGKYLWYKMVTSYLDENKAPTESDPICISGKDGQDGKDGENGADGVPGKDGADGVSMIYKGEFTAHPSNAQNGWYYRNSKDKKTYVFQDGNWYQMTIDGLDGRDGNDGKDGLSIEFKGELQSPPSNPQKNWTYKDTDNGVVYIYTGTAWEVMTYDGSNGEDGAKGQDGLSVYCTYHDSISKPSVPVSDGTTNGWHTNWTSTIIWVSQKIGANGVWGDPIRLRGQDGKDGTGINILDKLTDTSKLPAQGNPGDCYTVNGVLYVWSQQSQTWIDAGSIKGEQGEPGKNKYLHIKYSDDGKTFTSNYGETPGIYLGVLVDEVEQDSMNFNDYTWNRIRGDQGLQGIQGPKGEQGVPGTPGNDGKTAYFHIKYSTNSNGYPMTETPSTYIGTYVDYNATDSTNYMDYTWSRFQGLQGEQGEQGIPGENGINGQTYYLHIKYSNDGGSTFTSNNGETPGNYIGVYTDTNATDSTSVSSYKWTKIKGEQGPQGATGEDGVSVEELIIQYASNTSTTTAPTTGWGTSMPNYQEGYYLWYRTRLKYSNSSSYVYGTPVCDQSWKASQEAFSQIQQLKNKISLIVQDGTSSSSVTLTPYLIQLIADSDIRLSAKKILINGLLAGTGWQVDEEGNLDINDLNIRGTFTCNSINVDNLVSANIPTALPSTKNVTLSSGESLNEYLDSLPLNLGGYSVNIYLSVDISENIELRRHYNGIVNIFLCGKTIKGSVCGSYNNAIYNIYGGSTESDTTSGSIMPYSSRQVGSYYYSIVFMNCPNVNLYNIKVYGDVTHTSSSVGIGCQLKSRIYMENITFIGAKYNCRTYSMGEVYCYKSSGTSSGNSWSAGTGSRITLNSTTQAGGGNNTYTSGNGQIISTGVTFSTTAISGSNTSSSSSRSTKVETYKPNYADTYRSSVYNNWKKDGVCRQGDWGYGDCNGCWFYGSQFEEVKGKNITKVTITVTRSSSTGNSGSVSHVFQAHTHTSRPSGMPNYTACNKTLSLGWGETGTVTITDDTILKGIKNGTIKGFGIKSSYTSSYYSALTNGTVKIYYKE